MHEISIEAEFCAAHALVIAGRREAVHGHNFRVTVTAGADRLDGDGLVCDFHALEALLGRVLAPMRDADLNAVAPFDRVNPSAERIAERIGEGVRDGLSAAGGAERGLRVVSVRVTEAPGCAATFRPRAGTNGGER